MRRQDCLSGSLPNSGALLYPNEADVWPSRPGAADSSISSSVVFHLQGWDLSRRGLRPDRDDTPVQDAASALALACAKLSPAAVDSPPVAIMATAAKGPVTPPETPFFSKPESGWKGSSPTSAFRPPAKSCHNQAVSGVAPKQIKLVADFDLNVTNNNDTALNRTRVTSVGSAFDLNQIGVSALVSDFTIQKTKKVVRFDFDLNDAPSSSEQEGEEEEEEDIHKTAKLRSSEQKISDTNGNNNTSSSSSALVTLWSDPFNATRITETFGHGQNSTRSASALEAFEPGGGNVWGRLSLGLHAKVENRKEILEVKSICSSLDLARRTAVDGFERGEVRKRKEPDREWGAQRSIFE